jgi:uncharacterized protein YlxW (UPF0749 family)
VKKESQIAILKTIVAWQADEIEALQKRLQAATELTNIREEQLRDELTEVAQLQKRLAALDEFIGTVDGLEDITLRVQVQSPDEHATAKALRWGKATPTAGLD